MTTTQEKLHQAALWSMLRPAVVVVSIAPRSKFCWDWPWSRE